MKAAVPVALAEGPTKRDKGRGLRVASRLTSSVQEVLLRVRFGAPLPPGEAPRPGPAGRTVAPNGDPLIRVKLSDGRVSGNTQYALINPKTNQFYKEDSLGAWGPLSLPKGSQFEERKFTEVDLKQLEGTANGGGVKASSKPALRAALEKLLLKGDRSFDGQAVTKDDAQAEIVIKREHPFTYTAIVLKDDSRVVIKKVLTGGFVPAGPDDGSYSQRLEVK